MLIKTKDFDFVEVSESDIITFPEGVYAFEEFKKFVILKNEDSEWMYLLQSIDGEDPRFILLDPFMFFDDYKPTLSQKEIESLGAQKPEELSIFAITTIPDDISKMTANLKSPVIINFEKKIGAQLILEDKSYSMRTPIFSDGEGA